MSTAQAQDPALSALKVLIEETLKSTTDAKVKANLIEARKIVQTASVRKQGILNKFALDGQVALVTGGGRGIGKCIAHALGEAGCKVAVVDIDLQTAEDVAKELQNKGIESIALKADVSNKQDVEKMVENIVSQLGDLHIAVNNAGINRVTNIEDMGEKEWTQIMSINLNGVFYCCQAEAKHMLKMGRGSIINIGSMSATIVNRPQKHGAYNTSKAAVVHLTKSLACEWADRGVRVNSISPGYTDTEMNRSEAIMEARKANEKDCPFGRFADPDEHVGGVLYLASPLASYVTGLDLLIDGGFTCW